MSDPIPPLIDRLFAYVDPMKLILINVIYFIRTLLANPLLAVSDMQTFRHKVFANFWTDYGQAMSEQMPEGTGELIAKASGTVLDVGPGSGTQLHFFDPSKISVMYGIEPAIDMHTDLLATAHRMGFEGKYEAVGSGAEPSELRLALSKQGAISSGKGKSQEVFDTIVCIRSLCGVTNYEATINGLYNLLKSGGRLLVVEHVANSWPNGGSLMGFASQRFHMFIGWRFWMAGCSLDRDIDATIRRVGGGKAWREANVRKLQTWSPFPKIVGEYIKR